MRSIPPPDKPIHIELKRTAQSLVLRVTDQGIGIPADDLSHLFEPFHRAKNIGTIPGTGLGFVITRKSRLSCTMGRSRLIVKSILARRLQLNCRLTLSKACQPVYVIVAKTNGWTAPLPASRSKSPTMVSVHLSRQDHRPAAQVLASPILLL